MKIYILKDELTGLYYQKGTSFNLCDFELTESSRTPRLLSIHGRMSYILKLINNDSRHINGRERQFVWDRKDLPQHGLKEFVFTLRNPDDAPDLSEYVLGVEEEKIHQDVLERIEMDIAARFK